jgi:hypothetical protein
VKRDVAARTNVLGELLSGAHPELLREEHLGLYNLFGDPATATLLPAHVTLAVEPVGDGAREPDAPLVLELRSPLPSGTVLVTLETRRGGQRARPATDELDALPLEQALARIANEHDQALRTVLWSTQAPLQAGTARVELRAPAEPGHYVLKGLVTTEPGGPSPAGATAIGHVMLEVATR